MKKSLTKLGHSMSSDPELYIWTWATPMKFC